MTTKVFLDTEFTGLHQRTSLISIALVTEHGKAFYAEVLDFDRQQVDPWVQRHVVDHLWFAHTADYKQTMSALWKYLPMDNVQYIAKEIVGVASDLRQWISDLGYIEIWGDVPSFDWVLFNDLLGGPLLMPHNVYYIPFDLATAFRMNGLDPDLSRRLFSLLADLPEHNALADALMIRSCYRRIITGH